MLKLVVTPQLQDILDLGPYPVGAPTLLIVKCRDSSSDKHFPESWIGRGGQIGLPACSQIRQPAISSCEVSL